MPKEREGLFQTVSRDINFQSPLPNLGLLFLQTRRTSKFSCTRSATSRTHLKGLRTGRICRILASCTLLPVVTPLPVVTVSTLLETTSSDIRPFRVFHPSAVVRCLGRNLVLSQILNVFFLVVNVRLNDSAVLHTNLR